MCNKWISPGFTDRWKSLKCYWPVRSLSTMSNTELGAYFHTVEFNIWLFILNWGIGYLVHPILIRQLQWHLREQLFSAFVMLRSSAQMLISWSKSWHCPIFNIWIMPKWWTVTYSSVAVTLGTGTHKKMRIIFQLFSKMTPPRVACCLQCLAFQARPDSLTRQSRSATRSAHVDYQFHSEYQM